MTSAIDRVFRKLFPERERETLSDIDKANAILDHCRVQEVGEDAMIEALAEIIQLQFSVNTHEWQILRTKSHIEEILGVTIGWEDAEEVLSLVHKGKEVSEIAAHFSHAA